MLTTLIEAQVIKYMNLARHHRVFYVEMQKKINVESQKQEGGACGAAGLHKDLERMYEITLIYEGIAGDLARVVDDSQRRVSEEDTESCEPEENAG